MAVRIENTGVLNFGTFLAQAVVTHARAQVGSAILTTRMLATTRTIAVGGQAEFAVGEIDLLFPANEMENAGYNALFALALNGTNSITIKLMTSSTSEVNVAGYADVDVTGWSRSNESDSDLNADSLRGVTHGRCSPSFLDNTGWTPSQALSERPSLVGSRIDRVPEVRRTTYRGRNCRPTPPCLYRVTEYFGFRGDFTGWPALGTALPFHSRSQPILPGRTRLQHHHARLSSIRTPATPSAARPALPSPTSPSRRRTAITTYAASGLPGGLSFNTTPAS